MCINGQVQMKLPNPLRTLGHFLSERQRWVLLCMLAVLHLTLLAGGTSTIGLMCWLVDVGLFILWQPFIQTEQKLGFGNLLFIALALSLGAWLFGWWLLVIWAAVLGALLGGRVMLISHRPTRIFHLLAFAYLIGAVLIWLVPKIVPDSALVGPSLERQFAWLAPLLFLGMLLMPRPQENGLPRRSVMDFFYSLFIFLLIAVLVLGSLAFMLIEQILYFEALFRTIICVALLLLLIAWSWNPRPGFSGVGAFFSRYLLTVGVPFDTWLQKLMDCAERENDPDRFMQSAGERLLPDLPWVVGGRWFPVQEAQTGSGNFGETSAFRQEFNYGSLQLTIYTRHPLSPVLVWHLQLLTQLSAVHYLAKWRARELQQISYLRAVHEMGARLTHDVKNLLQSLDSLCYMMQASKGDDAANLHSVLQRQLPQIAQRLQQTLLKLHAPLNEPNKSAQGTSNKTAASAWWESLQQRFAQNGIVFEPVEFDASAHLPGMLFDHVADNLLHNALIKRQNESGLDIRVSITIDGTRLQVCDNGSAVCEEALAGLLQAPVVSAGGFGIGLYQAAQQAESCGYVLRLANNVAGRVCFELAKRNLPD